MSNTRAGTIRFAAWRLEVAPGAPRPNDRFLHVLTAADTSVSSAPQTRKVVKDGMDGVIVTLPASSGGTVEVTVLFNREGPVGGMIAIGKDAPLRPFTTAIQPQSDIF